MESCLDFCAVQKGNVSVPVHFHINWTACNSPGQNLVKDQYQALLWRITSLIWKMISKNALCEAAPNSKVFDPKHLRFTYLTRVIFGSVSNFDIDFINFRFIFDMKIARWKIFLQLHVILQFKHVRFTWIDYFWLWNQCQTPMSNFITDSLILIITQNN